MAAQSHRICSQDSRARARRRWSGVWPLLVSFSAMDAGPWGPSVCHIGTRFPLGRLSSASNWRFTCCCVTYQRVCTNSAVDMLLKLALHMLFRSGVCPRLVSLFPNPQPKNQFVDAAAVTRQSIIAMYFALDRISFPTFSGFLSPFYSFYSFSSYNYQLVSWFQISRATCLEAQLLLLHKEPPRTEKPNLRLHHYTRINTHHGHNIFFLLLSSFV